MNVYVIGAGVSHTVGYPLGSELFGSIDRLVTHPGRVTVGSVREKDWTAMKHWLAHNRNPAVAESYRLKRIEHLFTFLDLVRNLRGFAIWDSMFSRKRTARAPGAVKRAWRNISIETTDSYQVHRNMLLQALQWYFEDKHRQDAAWLGRPDWDYLQTFGKKLRDGDVIITFNYDSSLERVLWYQRKWSPRDGYGFEVNFQRSRTDRTRLRLSPSRIKILHLHGCVGWYEKTPMKLRSRRSRGLWDKQRSIPTDHREIPVVLDPTFLHDLGVPAVDVCMPQRHSSHRQMLLHPSFMKDFELKGAELFTSLWRQAGAALTAAERITIIGYSLPSADTAALTLLLTNCGESKLEVINPDSSATTRILGLFRVSDKLGILRLDPAGISFEEWVNSSPVNLLTRFYSA